MYCIEVKRMMWNYNPQHDMMRVVVLHLLELGIDYEERRGAFWGMSGSSAGQARVTVGGWAGPGLGPPRTTVVGKKVPRTHKPAPQGPPPVLEPRPHPPPSPRAELRPAPPAVSGRPHLPDPVVQRVRQSLGLDPHGSRALSLHQLRHGTRHPQEEAAAATPTSLTAPGNPETESQSADCFRRKYVILAGTTRRVSG